LGAPPSPKNGGQTSKFGANFKQLHNVIVHISGRKQDIVEWKRALQTAISSAQAYINLVNFGPQTAKNRTVVSTDPTR